ncbi:hypothetical protein ACFR97_12715 [Haloplanus litoreus]|uniref:Uncharacterized protein n=1 Tax=Haloplanus litoreus TaxID=767515 RepID=A0ABD5ZYH3_9EURY
MTADDAPDSEPERPSDHSGPSPEQWNPESTFCTDDRGSFFAGGHRVSVGRVYKDTQAETHRAVHSVDEGAREAVLYAVERDVYGEFSPADDDDPLVVSWHDEGGRFLPI